MKLLRMLFLLLLLFFAASSTVAAGDFDWMRDINIQAQADPSGFRASLATRFKIGDVQVNAVLGNITDPADAYMVLRLGEMCGRSPEYVMERYRSGKGQGWGALAKSLGIKPGSPEFHALKRGHDLHGGFNAVNVSDGKGKGNGKGKGKKRK